MSSRRWCSLESPLTASLPPPSSPGMPLIYWFSRRMTLWGSISFNLAVFINIIIAFFYPYMEGASTGEDIGLADRDSGVHCAPPTPAATRFGQRLGLARP